MRKQLPEQYRVTLENYESFNFKKMLVSIYASKEGDTRGVFYLPRMGKKIGMYFFCMITDGMGWEHLSVSIVSGEHRCPTWEEMCYIKEMFFDESEAVVQFHPAKEDYINNHEYCLHLWRYLDGPFPTPDPILVGIKSTSP